MRFGWTLVCAFLLTPGAARAADAPLGFKRVPRHLTLEVGEEGAGYRFWLVSPAGVEPLDLAPGHPCRIEDHARGGVGWPVWVVAATPGSAAAVTSAGGWRELAHEPLPPGVRRSEAIEATAQVPVLELRRELSERKRVFVGPDGIAVVRVAQEGTGALVAIYIATGVGVSLVVAGVRVLRRRRRAVEPRAAADGRLDSSQ